MNEHIPYTQSNTVKDTTQNYQDSGNSPLSSPTDHYPKSLAICQKYGVLGTKIPLTVSPFLVPLLPIVCDAKRSQSAKMQGCTVRRIIAQSSI